MSFFRATWALAAEAACPVAEVLAPARGATLAEARPAIEWRALEGAARYRVQAESRVPEGRVLGRTDTVVAGTRFVPAAALTDDGAAVKVVVSADCGAAAPSVIEEPARFFIDRTGNCPAPRNLEAAGGRASWNRVEGARRYRLAAYSALDGRSLAQSESLEPAQALPALEAPAYLMVRARCADAWSAPAYRLLASPSAR